MGDYQYILILFLGIAVGGGALLGALAIGPYGRRGLRFILTVVSIAAFFGSAFWLFIYLGYIDQRRSIETRLSELRAQALNTGSTLACLERSGDGVELACAQTLFAAPETLAAANFYTASRMDLLVAAARYSGPRTPQFDDAIATLGRSLQQDPFGLAANILTVREGCTAQRCEVMTLFRDPVRLWDNMRQKAFEANFARHAGKWGTPAATATPVAPASATSAIAPTGGETRAPIADKYTLPSAASIPPVSIMVDEPPQRPASAAPAKGPTQTTGAASSAETSPSALPHAEPQTQQPTRRTKARSNAPLSIAPSQ